MTLPKEIRYRSVRWILSKKSTEKQEAKRHGVTLKAIRNWITRYKKEHGQLPSTKELARRDEPIRSDVKSRIPNPVSRPVVPDAKGNDAAYERALESAGASDDAVPDADVAAEDPSVPAIPESVEDTPPPIAPPEVKPEELIAFAELLVTKIPQSFAVLKRIEVPPNAFAFTEEEKQSLAMTAPYACQYAPPIFAKIPGAMACVFVGTLVLSCVQRLGYVKNLAYERDKAKAEIRKAEVVQSSTSDEPERDPHGFPPSQPVVEGAKAKDHRGFPA